jgi:hypothetical protein
MAHVRTFTVYSTVGSPELKGVPRPPNWPPGMIERGIGTATTVARCQRKGARQNSPRAPYQVARAWHLSPAQMPGFYFRSVRPVQVA